MFLAKEEQMNSGRSSRFFTFMLIAATIGAFSLRCFGLLHGIGAHPDERHMISVTLDLHPEQVSFKEFPYVDISGLNPKSFAYGSLSYYVTRFVAELLSRSGVWINAISYDGLYSVGRGLCILIGSLAIPLIYVLGREMFACRWTALLGACLLGMNVLHLQLSRFFTSDVILTTLTLVALICMVKAFKSTKILWWILSGIALGLSVATKISGLALFAPFLTGVIMLILDTHFERRALMKITFYTVITIFLAGLTCFIVEPFAVIEFSEFVRQVREQTEMARGTWEPPYTKQYYGTTPYLYPLQQMALYTMGLPVFICASLGFVGLTAFSLSAWLLKIISNEETEEAKLYRANLVHLSWIFAVFFGTAGLLVKYPRYLLPIYPSFLLCGAWFLVQLTKYLQKE